MVLHTKQNEHVLISQNNCKISMEKKLIIIFSNVPIMYIYYNLVLKINLIYSLVFLYIVFIKFLSDNVNTQYLENILL